MSGYSKAAQGLFVLPWLIGVFTDSVISPGTLSRQLPDRSAFRAGRNLPDKEFRSIPLLLDSVVTGVIVHTLYVAIQFGLYLLRLRIPHWSLAYSL